MREITLCLYSYDPLDQLVGTFPLTNAGSLRFYCKNLPATEIQGALTYSIFQHEDRHLAQQQRDGKMVKTGLLAIDQQRSVQHVLNPDHCRPISFSPYGHRSADNGLLSLMGFNGEWQDPVTGCYFLGNGYRIFSPVLMRFNSPDFMSPFREGGLNPYAYCLGDPINFKDPSGNVSIATTTKYNLSWVASKIGITAKYRKDWKYYSRKQWLGHRELDDIQKKKNEEI